MANKTLFKSLIGKLVPAANTVNEAGGSAYLRSPKAMLAQFAATGCLTDTFYASADSQLTTVLSLCGSPAIEAEFIARTALYARGKANMKDLPALLCAVLAVRSPGLLAEVFDRVIDDGRMLRNFVQIIRSGVTGRKSLGSLPKRLVNAWFDSRSDEAIFRASVGNDPSLADVIRMTHPKPTTLSRAALYGYLIGQPHDATALPEIVKQFEAFKAGRSADLPDVPFQMLTALDLKSKHWKQIAKKATWQMARQNLNTFARHGVFDSDEATAYVASLLRSEDKIRKARVFPYQLLTAYKQTLSAVPASISDALQDAMEIATGNVPQLADGVFVLPDVSGSMHSPITGVRRGATSVVRCIDVAALIAATILRTNRRATVLPFESKPVPITLNPRDSVMTNAEILSKLPAGGTNCSAPLAELNKRCVKGDLVIYVSDNESWIDTPAYGRFGGSATETMKQWAVFKSRNPRAKLVCIDLQPTTSTQATHESAYGSGKADVLNVGGFSDSVFDVIAAFVADENATGDRWVAAIEAVSI